MLRVEGKELLDPFAWQRGLQGGNSPPRLGPGSRMGLAHSKDRFLVIFFRWPRACRPHTLLSCPFSGWKTPALSFLSFLGS